MTRRAWVALLLALVAGIAAGTDAVAQGGTPAPGEGAAAAEAVGQPRPERPLRDAEFGVVTHQFGLERTVEMYQWNRAGQGYFAGWSLAPVDSTGFAPDHANPGTFPLQSQQWRDLHVTLDGKPMAPDAVARLGEWRAFRPNFSALPGNLSATFQPEGDGLGSAENPLDPQVGDLRVTWRELVLPPLQGRIALRDGQWSLPGAPAVVVASAEAEQDGTLDEAGKTSARRWAFPGAGLLVLLAVSFAYYRRKRRQLPKRPS